MAGNGPGPTACTFKMHPYVRISCGAWGRKNRLVSFLLPTIHRTDAENLGDCLQEVSLVSKLTRGSKVFLTREETQHFIKEYEHPF